MKEIKKIKIRSFKSFSGKLIPISFNKNFPFRIKRIFFLYGLKNKIRGEHAHKKCSQIFMPISGRMILFTKTPFSKKKFLLDSNSKHVILVPPKYWCSVKFITNNSIMAVACDKYYDFNDYLENFEDYTKYFNKR